MDKEDKETLMNNELIPVNKQVYKAFQKSLAEVKPIFWDGNILTSYKYPKTTTSDRVHTSYYET